MDKHCINCKCYCFCADVDLYGEDFDNAEFCDYYKESDKWFFEEGKGGEEE